jgi:glucosamine-6-phosphate deaminase
LRRSPKNKGQFNKMTMNMNVLAEPLELEKEAISFERVPTKIYKDANEASKVVAHEIAQIIRRKNAQGKPAVLGLNCVGGSATVAVAKLLR